MNNINQSSVKKGAKLKKGKSRPLSKVITTIILALFILGLCSSAYDIYLSNYTFEGKVYNAFVRLMAEYPNPADKLLVEQFKDTNTYVKKFNELNDAYDKKLGETVAEYYGITVDEATTIYTEEYMRRNK